MGICVNSLHMDICNDVHTEDFTEDFRMVEGVRAQSQSLHS